MSNLIRRQDAIDALNDEYHGMLSDESMKIYQIKNWLEGLPSAEPQWIPVSERLPIPPTFCLVTTDGSHGDVIDIALYMSDGWHKASEVLAWMPLPEPYKGGECNE